MFVIIILFMFCSCFSFLIKFIIISANKKLIIANKERHIELQNMSINDFSDTLIGTHINKGKLIATKYKYQLSINKNDGQKEPSNNIDPGFKQISVDLITNIIVKINNLTSKNKQQLLIHAKYANKLINKSFNDAKSSSYLDRYQLLVVKRNNKTVIYPFVYEYHFIKPKFTGIQVETSNNVITKIHKIITMKPELEINIVKDIIHNMSHNKFAELILQMNINDAKHYVNSFKYVIHTRPYDATIHDLHPQKTKIYVKVTDNKIINILKIVSPLNIIKQSTLPIYQINRTSQLIKPIIPKKFIPYLSKKFFTKTLLNMTIHNAMNYVYKYKYKIQITNIDGRTIHIRGNTLPAGFTRIRVAVKNNLIVKIFGINVSPLLYKPFISFKENNKRSQLIYMAKIFENQHSYQYLQRAAQYENQHYGYT